MLQAFVNIGKIPELRRKLLITAGLLSVYRLGKFIPCPGVNTQAVSDMLGRATSAEGWGKALALADMFAGGALSQGSIFGLGIMPYISAAIIFQLLVAVIPSLQKIWEEGESGRKKITQYTRYATVGLCVIQSFFIVNWLRGLGGREVSFVLPDISPASFLFLTVISLTAGTTFIMWLGEQIDEFGIGSGCSLIIMAGIVSGMPSALRMMWRRLDLTIGASERGNIGPELVVILVALFVFMIVAVVMLTQAQRRIPMHSARRTVQGFSHRSYLPLRLNMAGVISIIFAQSLMMLPGILRLVPNRHVKTAMDYLLPWGFFYVTLYVLMIIFFTYFYTAVVFDPIKQADQFKQYGTFIPGIRPGRKTAEYIDNILKHVTLAGAVALAYIALVPQLISWMFRVDPNVADFFGGTGLLIVVGVALDVVQRIESYMMMQYYEGFIAGGGRIRGRRG